jgi:hypothetical protein
MRKLTGSNGAQRNCRQVQRLVRQQSHLVNMAHTMLGE